MPPIMRSSPSPPVAGSAPPAIPNPWGGWRDGGWDHIIIYIYDNICIYGFIIIHLSTYTILHI